MTTALQDCPAFPDVSLSAHVRRYYIQVTFSDGAGTTSTITSNLPTLPAVGNGSSSVFAVTNLPPAPATGGDGNVPRYYAQIYSPAATITEPIITAYDAVAGTLSFRTSKAGTATNPASTDKVWLFFEMAGR